MRCQRCHGMLWPVDFIDRESSMGSDLHGIQALRCIACGDIVDQVILQNRAGVEHRRLSVRRNPRYPIQVLPVS